LYAMQLEDRLREPTLTQWSAWGERIDRIEVTPLWKRCAEIAPRYGLVAAAYEARFGEWARLHQFALNYLFGPSSDVYTCPLAMTDGAARTLIASQNQALIERALPRLTSRDPRRFWTSGQWMTERIGGSDVSQLETVAIPQSDGSYKLYGKKWFCSAITSDIALVLARPQGNPQGSKGLALFYIETRDANGKLRAIEIDRLKDKLGTRKLPTAELSLKGVPAIPVRGTSDGVRVIAPMLNITRTWNAVMSVAFMRRGIVLARDYARKRVAFSSPLSQKPLHLQTLAEISAQTEAMLHLAFESVAILGRLENGSAQVNDEPLFRMLTPIVKLLTAKSALSAITEVLECFGGAGYIEDTGIPGLLRDVQVLPLWEGTTNVLSLDLIRALRSSEDHLLLWRYADSIARHIQDAELAALAKSALRAMENALAWAHAQGNASLLEASARRLAMTLGRSFAMVLFARHADWSLTHEKDPRSKANALIFGESSFDFAPSASGSLLPLAALDGPPEQALPADAHSAANNSKE
ncbi:MAG: acyl-CoA dehydrogenase family protein, partial [Sandaracinaceae bacterium]|nr:acyl-CoA dehydrogenase family protein [Sandaracinaceae bacterium]